MKPFLFTKGAVATVAGLAFLTIAGAQSASAQTFDISTSTAPYMVSTTGTTPGNFAAAVTVSNTVANSVAWDTTSGTWVSVNSTTLAPATGSPTPAYVYETFFTLDASTPTLSYAYSAGAGNKYEADDLLNSLTLINAAHPTGIAESFTTVGNPYSVFNTFTINAADLAGGMNILRFGVTNLNPTSPPNPTGLKVIARVTETGTPINPSVTPEASSFSLMAMGALPLLGVFLRRRKSN